MHSRNLSIFYIFDSFDISSLNIRDLIRSNSRLLQFCSLILSSLPVKRGNFTQIQISRASRYRNRRSCTKAIRGRVFSTSEATTCSA